jgi:RimJ/RimL family protein N-acetyltransferase
MIEIRIATQDDILNLIEHEINHMQELGYNDLPMHPFPTDYNFSRSEERKSIPFARDLMTPGWKRSIIGLDNGKIIAHLNLNGNIQSDLHRTKLGMGMDSHYRGQGLGKRLIQFAIQFCRENKIEYIDLSVFAHNIPAIKLYKSCGFKQIGLIEDCFRMNGLIIDDIQMSLKISS